MLNASQHHNRFRAQIEQQWEALAHDPAQQALVCAALCPPHLVEWLKAKILAELPDTLFRQLLFGNAQDGRIQALNRLAERTKPPEPLPVIKPAPKPARRTSRKNKQRILFGVPIQVVVDQADRQLRSDPELGRLAVALWLANQYRLWVIARELDRQAGGSGYVSRSQLKHKLKFYRVAYTDRQLRRLLVAGEGIFWRQDRKHRDRLYLVSWKQLSLKLIVQAEASGIEIGYNRPGAYQQLVDVSGSLEAWTARLYAAWIAYRANDDDLSIARATLATLFNRSEKTLRQWEAGHLQGVVTKRYDFEQHPDDVRTQDELYDLQYHIPDFARPYTALVGQKIVHRRCWQRSNTYTSTIKSHTHRGQARKVRKTVNDVVSADQLMAEPRRQNYTVAQHRKRVRSLKFRRGQDGDVNAPVHVYLGTSRRTRVGVWELMIPDPGMPNPITGPNEWWPA